jgi:MATE family multidrug resistance protein
MKTHNFEMKNLFFLSLPLIFSNLINAATSLISMFLLSKININALAAGAIITSTYGLIVMIAISILYSVSIMVGKMQGAGQHQEIGPIVFSGIVIALLIGVPFTVLMFHMTDLFGLLGQPQKISELAGAYFQGIAFGLVPSLIGAVYMQLFMGTSRTKIILYLTMLGILINTSFSYLLIFGYWKIHPMGMFGGGLASTLTAWILLAITISFTFFSSDFFKYQLFKPTSVKLKYMPILLKIGTPISIQYSVEILSFSVLTYLMGLIGTDALGAQQIALQCSMVSIMIVMAISQSSTILVSQAVGQGDISSTIKIANSALLLGTLFMLIVAIVYWFFPLSLISLYLNINNPTHESTITLAKIILSISAFTQIFDSGRNIAAGLLRGMGDTKSSMWTGIVSCWIIGIPAAIGFGFLLHFGAAGIRFGIMLGILIGCTNLIYRFYNLNTKAIGEQFAYAK